MALISWAFMPRGSALRSNALAFRILLLTKKGPHSYYLLLTNDRPVRNSGDFELTEIEIARFDCINKLFGVSCEVFFSSTLLVDAAV